MRLPANSGRFLCFLHAMWAQTIKISDMTLDQAVKMSGSGLQNMINSLCFQIGHTAAFITDKMVMRMSIRVKMIYTVSDTQPGYLTQIGKQSQIPVNGSKTDVGKFCPYIAVNYICRRMVVSGH